jgi:hypothetical protein
MWTHLDSAGRAGFYSCQIVRSGLVIFIAVSTGTIDQADLHLELPRWLEKLVGTG